MSKHALTAPFLIAARFLMVAASIVSVASASAAAPISQEAYEHCRRIADEKARLQCFENLTSPQPEMASPPTTQAPRILPDLPQLSAPGAQGPSSVPVAGKWRLVHTPNPADGYDVVSVMATAELAQSDIDFVGLGLRCADPDFEVLVFLIQPLPPGSRPAVSLNNNIFQANVISPGTAILLPRAASISAQQQWRSLPQLSIDIEERGTKIHGLVSLDGFDKALQALTTSCLTR